MKFVIAKKDGMKCHGCTAEIMRGDDMVLNFRKTGDPAHPMLTLFHTQCYIPWYTQMYNNKWSIWKGGEGMSLRPKRGRPVKYTEPTDAIKLRRLTSLLSYHKGIVGHDGKVKVIQSKIDKLHI